MRTTRNSGVEGRFYPYGKEPILRQIRDLEEAGRYTVPELKVREVYGGVLPHAAHVYSGHQTLPFFHFLKKQGLYADTYVIVHPNHHGGGSDAAIDPASSWTNSLGEVDLDHELGKAMELPHDARAHNGEHSAEVLLPFLQYHQGEQAFSILPVCMREQGLEAAMRVAGAIGNAVGQSDKSVLVLASSDFTHFQSPEEGWRRDQGVLEAICHGTAAEVEEAVHRMQASVCGYGPVMALMLYSNQRNTEARMEILARGHSGEVHPSREVVDYVSLLNYR